MRSVTRIILALSLMVFMAGTSLAGETMKTRFGTVSTNDDNVLLVNGKPTTPKVTGNNSLTLVKMFKVGESDVILVQDNGGTACPAEYYFISLSSESTKVTKSFGTCSDLIKTSQAGDVITVKMPGFRDNKKPQTFTLKGGVLSSK